MKKLTRKEKKHIIEHVMDTINFDNHFLCNIIKHFIITYYNRYNEHYFKMYKSLGSIEARDEFLKEIFPDFVNFIIKEGKKLDSTFKYGQAWKTSTGKHISYRKEKLKEFYKTL